MTRRLEGISKSREQWNALADHWERQAEDAENKYTRRSRWIGELVDKNRISPCRALDVGCANGLLSSVLAQRGFDTYGTDVSDELIRLAARRMGRYFDDAEGRFQTCGQGALPFSDRTFGLVTMIGVFPYIENQPEYVRGIRRMIEADGYLVASGANRFSLYIMAHVVKRILGFRPTREWVRTVLNLMRTGVESGGNVERRSRQVHDAARFDRLFREVGFRKIDELDLFHISPLDKTPFRRSAIGRLLCRRLGWTHVGVYRKTDP